MRKNTVSWATHKIIENANWPKKSWKQSSVPDIGPLIIHIGTSRFWWNQKANILISNSSLLSVIHEHVTNFEYGPQLYYGITGEKQAHNQDDSNGKMWFRTWDLHYFLVENSYLFIHDDFLERFSPLSFYSNDIFVYFPFKQSGASVHIT